ncbi:uncharacterized protein LOC105186674 isoform X2 [Harpegnathos saltator]|uniref:uncharacterized protein LOC105186674 isoform X2 n=1 Tax=Harpegnathos saltator TaxID=610380 RepID=UPI00058C94C1|nr:uncharacterized protein LOC105186674 isoform X2 [Harpegnathos saltator]
MRPLLNGENNCEYKINVSAEDANKTKNDHEFAYLLLKYAKESTSVKYLNKVLSQSDSTDDGSKTNDEDNMTPDNLSKDYARDIQHKAMDPTHIRSWLWCYYNT